MHASSMLLCSLLFLLLAPADMRHRSHPHPHHHLGLCLLTPLPPAPTPSHAQVNVSSAIRRARALRCTHCKERGAALGCHQRGCQRVYHLPCAQHECALSDDLFTLYCPAHAGRRKP